MRGSGLVVRQQLMPLMGDGSRLQRTTVGLGNDKGVVRQRNTEPEKLLGLLNTVTAQFVHHSCRQGHRAPLPALGLLIANAGFGLFGALGHCELRRIEVDIAPSQNRYLAPTQAAKYRQDDRDRHARATSCIDQVCGLRKIVGGHGAALDLGRIDRIDWIVSQHLPAHRLPHCSLEDDVHVTHRARGKSAAAIPAAAGKSLGVGFGYLYRP